MDEKQPGTLTSLLAAGRIEGVRDIALTAVDGAAWRVSVEPWRRPVEGEPVFMVGVYPTGDMPGDAGGADERRLALIEVGNLLRDLEDPADIAYRVAEVLGRTLRVSRAGYGTVDRWRNHHRRARLERPGHRTLAGILNFRDYGTYIDDLKAGATAVVTDATGPAHPPRRMRWPHQRPVLHKHAGHRARRLRGVALPQP